MLCHATAFQGSWKLPGGLADRGEHLGDTVAREVRARRPRWFPTCRSSSHRTPHST